MSIEDDLWVRIITIHNYTKKLFIQAEELDEEFKTFLQPGNELKNALEHIMRYKATKYNIDSNDSHNFFLDDLRRAEGHECRAFFDTADWFSISLRKSIQDSLSPYSPDTIKSVYSDYYPSDRPQIDKICKSIASLREEKSICKDKELMELIDSYMNDIGDLYSILTKIKEMQGSFIELQKKSNKEKVKETLKSYLKDLIMGIIGIIAGIMMGKLWT